MKFVTIIPFYQLTHGLLTTAIQSALKQNADNHIIVVDDGSPLPAESELINSNLISDHRITLYKTENSGAAFARNYALDRIPDNVDAICFLDSDDRWEDNHLEYAKQALLLGYDFYFSDHMRDDWDTGKFERHAFSIQDFPIVFQDPCIRSPDYQRISARWSPTDPYCLKGKTRWSTSWHRTRFSFKKG